MKLHLRATGCHLPYGMTLATRHKWTHPTLTSARQAGTRITYPGRMEGWVDLDRQTDRQTEVGRETDRLASRVTAVTHWLRKATKQKQNIGEMWPACTIKLSTVRKFSSMLILVSEENETSIASQCKRIWEFPNVRRFIDAHLGLWGNWNQHKITTFEGLEIPNRNTVFFNTGLGLRGKWNQHRITMLVIITIKVTINRNLILQAVIHLWQQVSSKRRHNKQIK